MSFYFSIKKERPMYKTTLLIPVLLATTAHAQDTATMHAPEVKLSFFQKVQLQNACSEDIQRLCPGIETGGGRIMACVAEKKEQLSETCATTMAEILPQTEQR
jgi:hypothetical protein